MLNTVAVCMKNKPGNYSSSYLLFVILQCFKKATSCGNVFWVDSFIMLYCRILRFWVIMQMYSKVHADFGI